MKRLSSFALLVILAGLVNPVLSQQFNGKLIFDIEYLEVPSQMQGYESMLPSSLTMYLSEQKSRVEQKTGMMDQVIVYDGQKNEAFMLMNMLGSKVAVQMSSEELDAEKENLSKPTYTYFDESKMIMGYTSYKAEVSYEDMEPPMTIWYTTDIQNPGYQLEGLKGFPLEYHQVRDGLHMKFTASMVSEEQVPNSLFEIPDEYELMTLEELQNMGPGF